MKRYELIPFADADALTQAAAGAWLNEVEKAKHLPHPCCVALSGGRIATLFFAAVVEQAVPRAVSFDRVHFFWADERCVPPTDAESNFRIARELFLEPLRIPASQIHRIRGEDSPEAAAQAAEAEIRRLAPSNESGQPVLDLIFLGLGEDGHVASLFPGETESLASSQAVYRAISHSPKPPPNRVTLGYPSLAAARQIWMLAAGPGKEAALRESLSSDGRTPFARVLQTRGDTKLFADILIK